MFAYMVYVMLHVASYYMYTRNMHAVRRPMIKGTCSTNLNDCYDELVRILRLDGVGELL